MDSLSYLKLLHIQQGTLFMTHAKNIKMSQKEILDFLSSYPRGHLYVPFYVKNSQLLDKKNMKYVTEKGMRNPIYKIEDWDGLVVSIDSFCEFNVDYSIEIPMSSISKLRLASLHIVGEMCVDFVNDLKNLDLTAVEASMPNHGTLDDYISLVNGLKSSYRKENDEEYSRLMSF